MSTPQRHRRASGETVSTIVARAEGEKAEETLPAEVLPEERQIQWRTPGFARMRVEWRREDRSVIDRARETSEEQIVRLFHDAFDVLNQVYDLVRTPETDESGEVVRDRFGYTVWRKTPSGGWDEDFSRLTRNQKEHLLFLITTRLFAWEQTAVDLWGEAMLAKAAWEERFAMGFDAPLSGTEADRTAAGRLDSLEERYFAIYATMVSRKADAVVRTLTSLSQRLKDTLTV